jgi:cell division protein FtsW
VSSWRLPGEGQWKSGLTEGARTVRVAAGSGLTAGARSVRDVATGGLSAGARSVRDVASAFVEPSWSEDRKKVVLPPELQQDRMDLMLLLVALTLFGLGVIMVFSASSFSSQFNHSGPYDRLIKQASRGLVGLLLLVGAARIDYRRWANLSLWIALATLVLLVLVLIPGIGHIKKGAQRWLALGPLVIQPTEFARLGLILYLARLLSKRPERIEGFSSGPLPALLVASVFMLAIVVQPNLGSTMAVALTALGMCLAAGMRWKHFLIMAAPAVVMGLFLVLGAEVFHAYQSDRIHSWIAMWLGRDNQLKETYQLRQSLLAFGSGGWIGKGIGAGQQKWFFLPDAHTDFIYSIVGEEMGFAGAFCVILAFAILIWRGIRVALEADDRYGYMLASGITINFAVYAWINMAVTLQVLPTTGLPLPLVSYGGSALIANMIAVGLLLSVSRRRVGGFVLSSRVRRRSPA